MPHPSRSFRLAYLTGVYPAASHTFIQREIAALRSLGSDITTASIRKPDAAELIGPEETAARDETFYVLQAARNPVRLLAAHGALLLRAPGRWFGALGLALRTHRPGLKGLIWQIFYFLEAGVLARHLREEQISHLHNHFADSSATVAMLAARLADLPFSFTLHGPTELFAPESWHLGEKIARAALVVCISHFARSQLMLFSDPAHWHKLRIVHCGVKPERYATAPDTAADGPMKLLFVGRLAPVKGLRVLLEGFEIARAAVPGITLTVIGDGPDRPWLDQTAQRIGGISVLGYRSQQEVAQALGQSDVLVLPSFAEGVPVALMEAMASARPVIATRVGGVAELVEDGLSGKLVAPGDAQALAEAMIALGRDGLRRRAMGAAGRRKVSAEFDIDLEARWLKALFEDRAGDGLRPARGEDTAA
jgi:glycosyltransferase involved in cell wall biosynthesis